MVLEDRNYDAGRQFEVPQIKTVLELVPKQYISENIRDVFIEKAI